MKLQGTTRKLVLPFFRILTIIGAILYIIEQLIRIVLSPVMWILFGTEISEWCEKSFVPRFWDNVFTPFCKKIGITDLY